MMAEGFTFADSCMALFFLSSRSHVLNFLSKFSFALAVLLQNHE